MHIEAWVSIPLERGYYHYEALKIYHLLYLMSHKDELEHMLIDLQVLKEDMMTAYPGIIEEIFRFEQALNAYLGQINARRSFFQGHVHAQKKQAIHELKQALLVKAGWAWGNAYAFSGHFDVYRGISEKTLPKCGEKHLYLSMGCFRGHNQTLTLNHYTRHQLSKE